MVPPLRMQGEEASITSVILLLRFNLNQIMKIYETKQTYGYSTKVLILTYNFKNIKAMRVKEKLRKWSRWNETKEI